MRARFFPSGFSVSQNWALGCLSLAILVGCQFYHSARRARAIQASFGRLVTRDNELLAEALAPEPGQMSPATIQALERNSRERDGMLKEARALGSGYIKQEAAQFATLLAAENLLVQRREAEARRALEYAAAVREADASVRHADEALARIEAGRASASSPSWIERDKARERSSVLSPLERVMVAVHFKGPALRKMSQNSLRLGAALHDSSVMLDALGANQAFLYPRSFPAPWFIGRDRAARKVRSYMAAQLALQKQREQYDLDNPLYSF